MGDRIQKDLPGRAQRKERILKSFTDARIVFLAVESDLFYLIPLVMRDNPNSAPRIVDYLTVLKSDVPRARDEIETRRLPEGIYDVLVNARRSSRKASTLEMF